MQSVSLLKLGIMTTNDVSDNHQQSEGLLVLGDLEGFPLRRNDGLPMGVPDGASEGKSDGLNVPSNIATERNLNPMPLH